MNFINKIIITWIVLLAFSCSNGKDKVGGIVQIPKDITIGTSTGVKLESIGVELDPHFFSQNLTRNDGAKASDWQYVVNRVKKMGLQKFRVMVLPSWYEPVNDNDDSDITDLNKFTFESLEMQSLYKVLDLAQELDINVRLVLWGCPTNVSLLDKKYSDIKTCFMADPDKEGWITAPLDYNEWAENFSVLVKYLIEDKKYTCINEITPMNEPDGGCFSEPSEYIKMARILDARLKKDKIRSKVRFNLSDNTDLRVFYLTYCAKHLSDVADVFNSHTYIFGYNVPNDSIFNWEKNNVEIAKMAGKKHLVGEFGSNQCVGATRQKDIDFYVRGVLITRLALNFLNAGAAGVSYWSLIDQYYGRNESYSNMQQLGLWKYVKEAYRSDAGVYDKIKEDYEVRPQYYAYSLLTKYVRPGSDIYPIDLGDDYAIGSAFEDENGKWTYVFANAGEAQKTLLIGNPEANGSFSIYEYSEDTLPEGDNLIEPKETKKTEDGKLEVIVNPNTVLLCHQK